MSIARLVMVGLCHPVNLRRNNIVQQFFTLTLFSSIYETFCTIIIHFHYDLQLIVHTSCEKIYL